MFAPVFVVSGENSAMERKTVFLIVFTKIEVHSLDRENAAASYTVYKNQWLYIQYLFFNLLFFKSQRGFYNGNRGSVL